jgi:hypothetical protein
VFVGLKEPHGFVPVPPVQVTLQFTPFGGTVESFVMVAVSCAVVPASMEVGGSSITTVSVGAVIVTCLDMLVVGAAWDAAVIVTRPPLSGSVLGAWYMVLRPFAVGFVENVPQPPPPSVQATDQLTPLGVVVGSLVTVALTVASADRSKVDGGVVAVDVQFIETLPAAVIVTIAVAVATGVATVVAVIVTTPPPLGIIVGA